MEILRFGLLGLGTGAIYAMVASGLVVVYRGSGVVNFAQGAFVMVGAYAYLQFAVNFGWPTFAALCAATAFCGVVGAAVHLIVLRPMRRSSPLARVIATLGLLVLAQSIAVLHYGLSVRSVPSALPTRGVQVLPHTLIGLDRIFIFLIGACLTAVLWAAYRYTPFGRATSAVAENPLAAASLGHSPDRIAAINWAVGSAVAGLAGALIAPITFIDPTQISLLIVPALAASVIGGFASFPIAFATSIVIGAGESLLTRYVSTPGWSTSVPFLVVIVVLLFRGHGVPVRGFILDRLPGVGSGRIRVVPALIAFVVLGVVLLDVLSPVWATAFAITIILAIMCLSIVVITGYAGQLSLAQYVLAGVGALVAARLNASWHWTFILALVGGVLVTCVVGAVVGLPALRTRGINLAVVTLGLAVVLFNVVLRNGDWTGGLVGILVDTPSVFGLNIDPSVHPDRYAFTALVFLFAVGLAVANIRRGATGRRMLAVRSNERAAAALGVSVYSVKLYAFVLAAGIAAIGGVLFSFLQLSVLVSTYDPFSSINLVAVTVVGGLGYVIGGVLGATLIAGGVFSQLFIDFDSFNAWLPLIGSVTVLLVLRLSQNGLFELNRDLAVNAVGHVRARLMKSDGQPRPPVHDQTERGATQATIHRNRVTPMSLCVEGISVRFANVRAVDGVSLTVAPGQVHGLIGPNGAGKTTLVDVVSGFTAPTQGSVQLGGDDITGWRPRRRARRGMGRSFQAVELFADMTVRENIAVGCDRGGVWKFVSDLVRPGRIVLTDAAKDAIDEFGLADDLDTRAESLPFGRRRLVAIARAVAAAPSVLLLDEPAAGLDDAETAELAELIRTLADDWGLGVLLIEHDIDMVFATCDTVTVLAAGSVLASGTADVIRNDAKVLEAYVGSSAEPARPRTEPVGASLGNGESS